MSKSQSLNAEIYQALHTGTFGDWQFYKSLVQKKLKLKKVKDKKAQDHATLNVLELGCGSGRILCELAELRIKLTGFELNDELLALCKANISQRFDKTATAEIDYILGDFSKLEACFDQQGHQQKKYFDLIILPYNGIYCLRNEEEQVQLIREAINLLAPQGELWFDGYALPDPSEYAYESADEYSPLTVIDLGASKKRPERVLGVEELDVFQIEQQRFTAHYRFVAPEEEIINEPLHGRIEQIEHRYLYPWQLPKLCQQAGAKILKLMADFGGQDMTATTDLRTACEWGIDAEHWVIGITKA